MQSIGKADIVQRLARDRGYRTRVVQNTSVHGVPWAKNVTAEQILGNLQEGPAGPTYFGRRGWGKD